jgi:hypothetical protein
MSFSGLHLYHHSILPIFGWLVIKIAPTSPCLGLFPLINTLIHIIMYSYYALSALGPKVQKYLWWKKYITQIQLMLFIIFGIYMLYFITQQTGYPVQGPWLYIGKYGFISAKLSFFSLFILLSQFFS